MHRRSVLRALAGAIVGGLGSSSLLGACSSGGGEGASSGGKAPVAGGALSKLRFDVRRDPG